MDQKEKSEKELKALEQFRQVGRLKLISYMFYTSTLDSVLRTLIIFRT